MCRVQKETAAEASAGFRRKIMKNLRNSSLRARPLRRPSLRSIDHMSGAKTLLAR
jgi:hypothetical protein